MTTKEETSKMVDEKKPTYGALGSITHGVAQGVGTVASSVGHGVGTVASGVGHGVVSAGRGLGHAAQATGGLALGAANSLKNAGLAGTGKLGEGYIQSLGWYDKLFWKHINKDFGDHLEVASRGACFVVLCAIPFVTPHEVCPSCHWIVDEGFFTSACVTYFIYTLYLYTGDIIHFAQGGIMGTVLAVVNIWLMQGFMPGGYVPDMPHRWIMGSIWGVLFVFLILWLNFDDNTRIFGLSTYVWYWMAFLKPEENAGFSQNFQIRLDGQAVREFAVALLGCGIAVLAAYVPYPIYAHTKAMETTKKMITQLFMAKQDFMEFYCGGQADPLSTAILAREMQTLQAATGSIAGLLDSAWYECLGRGNSQVQRVMMAKFRDYIIKSLDLLSNVFQICGDETFDSAHVEMMKAIDEPLRKVVNSNGEILKCCVAGLYDASFNQDLQDLAAEKKVEAMEGVKEMTATLEAARVDKGYNQVSAEGSGEHVAALTFAKFAHLTAGFYDSLQGEQVELRTWKEGAGLLGLFEPGVLFEKDHLMWTLRNAMSIIISFYIGWHGYNKYISSYNAMIASTVSVLLSKFVGSAMVKNLARLQGVVIGIVLGNLLYAFLGWCYWWGHLLVALALYFWTLLGLFMYFHSVNYSTVGLLLAVFGSQSLLRPCANEDTDPQGHGSIVNVTVAIAVMTIVDILLSPARTSDMARNNFVEAYKSVVEAMKQLFDPEVTAIAARDGALAGAIGDAESMGNEAALEPRYWRRDWPTSKFDQAISCLRTLRFCLNSIQNIVLNEKREKSEIFVAATKLPSFSGADGVKALLLSHVENVMDTVEKSIQDVAGDDVFKERLPSVKAENMKARSGFGKQWQGPLETFSKALNEGDFGKTFIKAQKSQDDISTDAIADCSLFIESLKAMFLDLDATLQSVVS